MQRFKIEYRRTDNSEQTDIAFVVAANKAKALKAFHLKVSDRQDDDILSVEPASASELSNQTLGSHEASATAGPAPEESEKIVAAKPSAQSFDSEAPYSFLSLLLFCIAGLALIVGLSFSGQLWPGDPGYGSEWKTLAYVPSFTWLTTGVALFAFFSAVGQGLHYLKKIAETAQLPNK